MKHKTLGKLKKDAWDLLSKIVRLSYADDGGTVECFTCGKLMYWEKDGAQAGHAIPGRNGAVLFDEEILRPQCYSCNVPGRGQHHIYSTKLIDQHGMDWWKCKLIESKKIRKWSRVELEETIKKYRERLKELSKES